MKKAEGPIGWTQQPAQGDHEDAMHAVEIPGEQISHGDQPAKVSAPNDSQGGK